MIHFIRNIKNETLVDVEVTYTKTDFGSNGFIDLNIYIDIENYSTYLLDRLRNSDNISVIIQMFDFINNLRGWLFEEYLYFENKNATKKDVDEKIKKMFIDICEQLDELYYIND